MIRRPFALPSLTLSLVALAFGCSGGGGGGTGGGAGGGAGGGSSGRTIAPASCTLTVDKATAVADNSDAVSVTVTVRDEAGQAVSGARVQVSMSGQSNFVSDAPQTGGDGVSRVTVNSSRAELKTVSAAVEIAGAFVTIPATATVTFVAGAPSGLRFETQPTTTKAGAVMTPAVTLRLEDNHGNPATDDGTLMLSMRLVRSTGGTVAGAAARPADGGVFTFDALVINRPQVGYALRAELSNGAADESQLFDVTLGDLSVAASTFVAAPPNLVADGAATTTLTLTARDTGGNALSGQAVTLAVTGTGNTLGAATGTTDASGVFSTTLASTVAEAKTVTATLGGASLTVTVTFIP